MDTAERTSLQNRRIASVVTTLVLGPGAGQIAMGRTARALLWIALFWAAALGTIYSGIWLLAAVIVIYLGAAIDCGLIRPAATKLPGWGKVLLLWILLAAVSVGLSNGLKIFSVEAFKTAAGAMRPTLLPGEHFWVCKWAFRPVERGDVIVFLRKEKQQKRHVVKRVVALGGDTVELRAGTLFINGQPAARSRKAGRCSYRERDDRGASAERECVAFVEQLGDRSYEVIQDPAVPSVDMQPLQVPRGKMFVLGDNRGNSHDSRQYGAVPLDSVVGEVKRIWFSAGKAGIRWDRIEREVR